MKLRILAAAAIMGLCGTVSASGEEPAGHGDWYFGIGGGFHTTMMRVSKLDKEFYPKKKNLNSGVFTLFGQYEFGRQRQFGVRLEMAFLNRGGSLANIGQGYFDYPANGISDVYYKLNSHYWDIRLPLMYNFCSATSAVRPYVFIAPVLGFSTGGRLNTEIDYEDGSYEGYACDLSKGNMKSAYFAGAVGVGCRYQFDISGNRFFLGVEADYEIGFTDTYSSKEKKGEVPNIVSFFPTGGELEGTRKFSGFEIKAVLGIPVTIFHKKSAPVVEPEPAPAPRPVAVAKPKPVVENKCFSLDEIISLMGRGENVDGKTICAVDDITFDFGKSTIRPESYAYLDKLAQTLIRTNSDIEVKGHTDNVGTEEFNMKLSKERARAVMKYLERKGVAKDKLSYSYYGMSRPLADNDTEEGRKLNRRVEIEILK